MIKEDEIAYFRKNVINVYVEEITNKLEQEENRLKLKSKTHQKCKRCHNIYPIEDFNGLYICKNCLNKQNKQLKKTP